MDAPGVSRALFTSVASLRRDSGLTLVDELCLFGSHARGALEPHDVDIAVDFHHDERIRQLDIAPLRRQTWPARA
ncbi:nucleotidyltransferase domain-containing protein [Streptomyces chartreusis]